ncbi:MAG: TRAM domain-containing protein [Victivallaceae bacterium]|nr:TRAM domain-containing protein [Victivallaceae bacterium]
MKIGDRFECVVESAAFGGEGVARVDGMVAFIPFTLPGERVVARIVKIKSDYLRCELSGLLEKSPDRIEPECPYFHRCPGCAYLHASYECELRIKREQLHRFLVPLGLAEMAGDFDGGGRQLGYRNKIVLHVRKEKGETMLGYVGRSPSELVEIAACKLAAPELNAELAGHLSDPGFRHTLHDGMDVTFRKSADKILMWRNSPPKSLSWLREETAVGLISVPPGSFSQINPDGAAKLLALLDAYLAAFPVKGKTVDAYSGAGLFGLAAAVSGAEPVVELESDAAAVEAAKFNFSARGIAAEFASGDAAAGLGEALKDAELLIVDPPRSGLSHASFRAIRDSAVARMVYISCDPATWSRDAAKLIDAGFNAKTVVPVNMFPRSAGFELFSVWER